RSWPSTGYRTSTTFFPVGKTRRMKPGRASQVTSYIFARGLHPRTNAALIMSPPPTQIFETKSSQASGPSALSGSAQCPVQGRAVRFDADSTILVILGTRAERGGCGAEFGGASRKLAGSRQDRDKFTRRRGDRVVAHLGRRRVRGPLTAAVLGPLAGRPSLRDHARPPLKIARLRRVTGGRWSTRS